MKYTVPVDITSTEHVSVEASTAEEAVRLALAEMVSNGYNAYDLDTDVNWVMADDT